jgi:hypothetical protein
MRGSDIRTGELFSYVDLEERVPKNHPLRLIRRIVNEVLAALDRESFTGPNRLGCHAPKSPIFSRNSCGALWANFQQPAKGTSPRDLDA